MLFVHFLLLFCFIIHAWRIVLFMFNVSPICAQVDFTEKTGSLITEVEDFKKYLLRLFFLEEFKVYSKIEGKLQRFPYTISHSGKLTILWACFTRMVHFLHLTNIYDTLQLPKFQIYITVTLEIICSLGLEKCIVIYIHYYGIILSMP